MAAASDDAETRRKLDERFPTKTVTRLVEVALTAAQIADKGRTLAGLQKAITDAKNLLKEECARPRADAKELETKRATIASEIENGKGRSRSPPSSASSRRTRCRPCARTTAHRRGPPAQAAGRQQ